MNKAELTAELVTLGFAEELLEGKTNAQLQAMLAEAQSEETDESEAIADDITTEIAETEATEGSDSLPEEVQPTKTEESEEAATEEPEATEEGLSQPEETAPQGGFVENVPLGSGDDDKETFIPKEELGEIVIKPPTSENTNVKVVMVRNVIHDNKEYKVGQELTGSDPVRLFLRQGYAQ